MGEYLFLIVVIIGGAAAVPLIAGKLSVPSAILEIIFGIVLFNFFLSEEPEWFMLLKEMGLIYLMFIAGMELDLRKLLQGGRFFWYTVIAALSLSVMAWLFSALGYGYFLGIVVAVTSAGIIIPVLKESGFMKTPLGAEALGLALSGEFVSILVLTVVYLYQSFGLTAEAGLNALKFVALLLSGLLFFKVLHLLAWWKPGLVEKVMESEDPVEVGIRAVLFVAFFSGLLAISSGVEPILGSFLAGIVFGYVFKSKGRFEDKINAVGFGFLTPFFFIGVGAEFNIGFIGTPGHVFFVLFLALMVLVSNLFPVLFSKALGIGRLESLSVSLLLSAPLSMMIVAGRLGYSLNVLSAEVYESTILAAVVTGMLYPYAFRPLGRLILRREEAAGER